MTDKSVDNFEKFEQSNLKDRKAMTRESNELLQLIKKEIQTKFTFPVLCKNDKTDKNIDHEQCTFLCDPSITEISVCDEKAIDQIIIQKKDLKLLKMLKQDKRYQKEISLAELTFRDNTKKQVVLKKEKETSQIYHELFIGNLLSKDPILSPHFMKYYGKQKSSNTLILEYVNGKSLDEMTDLSIGGFGDILSQIFFILNYAFIKYGFLHGDIKLNNFYIEQSPNKSFQIELPFRNGKLLRYKSNYRVKFIDFGNSCINYDFHTDNSTVIHATIYPFFDPDLYYPNLIPIIDISRLMVQLLNELGRNRHANLTPALGYITKFIKVLFEMIGNPNKIIDIDFAIQKINDEYGYINELKEANLSLSFEELYMLMVGNTDEHFQLTDNASLSKNPHNRFNVHYNYIKSHFASIDPKLNSELIVISEMKQDTKISKDIQELNDRLKRIVGTISSNENKIQQIHLLLEQSSKQAIGTKKVSFDTFLTESQLEYIYINTFYAMCHFEINRSNLEQQNEMVSIVDKVYKQFSWFRDNTKTTQTPPKLFNSLKSKEKYKVLEKMLEFKIDIAIDQYIKKTNVDTIVERYQQLMKLMEEDVNKTATATDLNETMKSLVIRNLSKMPLKLLQSNIVENHITVEFVNDLDRIKFIAENIRSLNNQMKISNIQEVDQVCSLNLKKYSSSQTCSKSSQKFYIENFFARLYKFCETQSEKITESLKDKFIDWVSYNRIILYDFFIRYLHHFEISNDFINLFFLFLELENEIWEKFYKEDHFWSMANSISLSKAMLTLLMNPKLDTIIPNLEKALKQSLSPSNHLSVLKSINLKNVTIQPSTKQLILSMFDEMYKQF